MEAAIVWNEAIEGSGQPDPAVIKSVEAALQKSGHEMLPCERDKGLVATPERFIPMNAQNRPAGIVFNKAYRSKGEWRASKVPTTLEMSGTPYTGPGSSRAALEDCGVWRIHLLEIRILDFGPHAPFRNRHQSDSLSTRKGG
ncbi:hypothetical protein [Bradyrhizobium manausense]|uniref:hypothetical protein n=1 Tax=Bradyrhizobium manausense TaxID=989370 RepID=UPI000AB0ECDE|nr:hypothetical protein [Bradyrhizobium manausense]